MKCRILIAILWWFTAVVIANDHVSVYRNFGPFSDQTACEAAEEQMGMEYVTQKCFMHDTAQATPNPYGN